MINLNNIKYLKRPKDVILFIKTFFSLIIIKVLLYLIKLPKLLKLLDPEKRMQPDDQKIEYILKFTNFVLFRLFRSSNPCLLRSILFFRQLRMMGKDAQIVFGVKSEEGKLKGHAWLIVERRHFPEPSDPSGEYQITFVYP
jgi:Transglutaminase-like superfamily